MKEKMKSRETQRIEKIRKEKQQKFRIKLLGTQHRNNSKPLVQLQLEAFT
jgi:hypothetical protein